MAIHLEVFQIRLLKERMSKSVKNSEQNFRCLLKLLDLSIRTNCGTKIDSFFLCKLRTNPPILIGIFMSLSIKYL